MRDWDFLTQFDLWFATRWNRNQHSVRQSIYQDDRPSLLDPPGNPQRPDCESDAEFYVLEETGVRVMSLDAKYGFLRQANYVITES